MEILCPFKKNQPFFNWNSQFRPNFISVYSVENVTYWTRNRRWGPPLFIFSSCPSVSVVKCMFCFVGTQYKDKQSDTHIVINNGTLLITMCGADTESLNLGRVLFSYLYRSGKLTKGLCSVINLNMKTFSWFSVLVVIFQLFVYFCNTTRT